MMFHPGHISTHECGAGQSRVMIQTVCGKNNRYCLFFVKTLDHLLAFALFIDCLRNHQKITGFKQQGMAETDVVNVMMPVDYHAFAEARRHG